MIVFIETKGHPYMVTKTDPIFENSVHEAPLLEILELIHFHTGSMLTSCEKMFNSRKLYVVAKVREKSENCQTGSGRYGFTLICAGMSQ